MEYYWIEPEVAGGVGPGADYNGMRQPRLVGTLHYEFEDWTGDDIVGARGFWIITDRVADALASSGLTGWMFDSVVVTTDDSWRRTPNQKTLPPWRRLMPVGTACQDDFGIKKRLELVVSERALVFMKQFTLDEAKIYAVSEYPDGPPEPEILAKFTRWLAQNEPG